MIYGECGDRWTIAFYTALQLRQFYRFANRPKEGVFRRPLTVTGFLHTA